MNELLFMVPPSALIRQIDVLSDSAFELSALSPAKIAVHAQVEATSVGVGNTVRVDGTIRNLGLRTANGVGVALDAQPAVLTVLGPATQRIGDVRHGQIRRFTGVSAQSSRNQTAAVAYLQVTPTASGHNWTTLLESLAAAALLAAAVMTARGLPAQHPIALASSLSGLMSLAFWLRIIGATFAASFAIAAGTSFVVLAVGRPLARRGRAGWITAAAIAVVALLANPVLLMVLAAAGGQ